jgi:hypothetical protein
MPAKIEDVVSIRSNALLLNTFAALQRVRAVTQEDDRSGKPRLKMS